MLKGQIAFVGVDQRAHRTVEVEAEALGERRDAIRTPSASHLREVLEQTIDCTALHGSTAVKLFICASNVMTGRIRVFDREDVTVDAVLASACLPFLFQAVEIDGEHYWDGGYMGNPPLYPLIYNTDCRDILIIQLNPINIQACLSG